MPLIPVLAKRRRHKISPTNWDPNGIGLSIWAAYEPKSAATLAASYVDLSGKGHNAGVGVAPTLSSGWVFNGSTQYLTTTFSPDNDQSQAVFIQFTDCTGSTDSIFGMAAPGDNDFYIHPLRGGNSVYYSHGDGIYVAPELSAGNLAIVGNQAYRNGVAEGTAIPGFAGSTALMCYMGAMNNNGTPDQHCSVTITSLYIYNATTGIDATQAAAIVAKMAAL